MRGQAYRRQKDFLAKRDAKERLSRFNYTPAEVQSGPTPSQIGFSSKTPQVCSNYCCGNPRHHFDGTGKITMQERRANARDDDWN